MSWAKQLGVALWLKWKRIRTVHFGCVGRWPIRSAHFRDLYTKVSSCILNFPNRSEFGSCYLVLKASIRRRSIFRAPEVTVRTLRSPRLWYEHFGVANWRNRRAASPMNLGLYDWYSWQISRGPVTEVVITVRDSQFRFDTDRSCMAYWLIVKRPPPAIYHVKIPSSSIH